MFISNEIPFVVKHHRHLNVSARLIIKNVTRDTLGSYSCMINRKINVKKFTLKLSKNKNGNDESNKSDTQGKIEKKAKIERERARKYSWMWKISKLALDIYFTDEYSKFSVPSHPGGLIQNQNTISKIANILLKDEGKFS